MSDAKVKSFEKARLERLSTQETVTDRDFCDMIYLARTLWAVPEGDFRDTFGLAAGTVDRWASGQNLPQEQVRGKILRWILGLINSASL